MNTNIVVVGGKNSGTLGDAIFSGGVALLQSTVIKAIVKRRAKKYLHLSNPPDQKLQSELRDLGLVPERLWWGPMTLFPEKAQFLIKQIEQHPPKQLLEVGAGTSTAIFAALGEKYGFDVLSLENHQGTIDYVQSLLKDLPCRRRVVVQNCGFIRKKYSNGDAYRWYDADLARAAQRFDFVFIDGPMGNLVGRNGALPEILPYLAGQHRIFLDDSQRPHEKLCLEEWRRHYPGLIVKTFEECFGISLLKIPLTDSCQY